MGQSIIVTFDERYTPEITRIRNAVFTQEQGIDEGIDFEGRDPEAIHVLVSAGHQFVGTGRMLHDGHIGRLAVLKEHREKGHGTCAVVALVDEAKRLGITRVFLGAQMQAVGFYEKLGFSTCGDPFLEAGIEHVEMEKFI